MKKSLQERLNASLDKALDPPRRRPQHNLDALLKEYDDGQALAARREAPREAPKGIPSGIPEAIPEGIPTDIPNQPAEAPRKASPRSSAPAAKRSHRAALAAPHEETAEESSAEIFVPVDATHTASEKIIYSHMYRETVSKGGRRVISARGSVAKNIFGRGRSPATLSQAAI